MLGTRHLAALIALLLLTAAFPSAGTMPVAMGSTATQADGSVTFCAAWRELANFLVAEPEPSAGTFEAFSEVAAAVEPHVPDELREQWDAYAQQTATTRDMFVTAKYDPERVGLLVERAYGTRERAEEASAAAEQGLEALEAWAATHCGDFCTRWPELRQALDELGGHLGWAANAGPDEAERLAELQRTLAIGSQLAPKRIRKDWRLAVASRQDWVTWWESMDFQDPQLDPSQPDVVDEDAAVAALRLARSAQYLDAEHLSDWIIRDLTDQWNEDDGRWRAIQAWLTRDDLPVGSRIRDVQSEVLWIMLTEPNGRHEPIDERLQAWVADQCAASAAGPGRLRVGLSGVISGEAGGTLVVAALPRGGSIVDLIDPDVVVASSCMEIPADPLRPWQNDEAGQRAYDTWELAIDGEDPQEPSLCRWGERRILPGDTYTLVTAVFPGALQGSHGTPDGLPPPTLCAQREVTVSGDTEVLLAAPGPCDGPDGWPTGPADDAWRNPEPVDPDTAGAGTLRVVMPGLLSPEGIDSPHGGELTVVVVRAGTTLNQFGREETWPLGTVRVWLPPREDSGQSAADRRRLERSIAVPIGPVPSTGAAGSLDPGWLASGPRASRMPFTVMEPGPVTVLVQASFHLGEDQFHEMCIELPVTVDGDTSVEVPVWEEWEECPPW